MSAPHAIDRRVRDPFPVSLFETIDIEYDPGAVAIWMNYRADSPHCYTPLLLREMMQFRNELQQAFKAGVTERLPVRYLVIASRKPGIYNLGGDLKTFAAAIRAQNVKLLREYAHACVDLVDSLLRGLDLPIVIVSAVHGQCYGGAFEAALATDYIFAEEDARFAFPEVAFNSFPGMGAVSLLTRKLGAAAASNIILEGKVYSGREMYDLNAIDHLATPGAVRAATRAWMHEDTDARWTRRRALAETRRRVSPIHHEELLRITDLWAECATRIEPSDIRYMERVANAQSRIRPSSHNHQDGIRAP